MIPQTADIPAGPGSLVVDRAVSGLHVQRYHAASVSSVTHRSTVPTDSPTRCSIRGHHSLR